MPDPAFILHVRPEDELRWKVLVGRSEVEAWYAAHGLCADDVVSGTMKISCWPDGYKAISVYTIENEQLRLYSNKPLMRSLPEGVGVICSAPQLD